jgi:hypothetical protein
MDTIRAINHEIFDYLRADTTLTDLMGNSNVREGLAFRSDDYPYIVYAINPNIPSNTPVIANCNFQTDIWDRPDSKLTNRIYEIRGRLIKLLDQHTFTLDGSEAKGIRVYLDSSGIILRDPDDEFIQHIVMTYTLRYTRSEDLVY